MKSKIDLKQVKLLPDGIECKGVFHLFADIAHLRFARTRLTTYVGLPIEMTKLGSEDSAGVMISLASGEDILLSEKPGWFMSSKPEKLRQIIDLYETLARTTFKFRLVSYLHDAEKHGYFVYSGCRFFPSRRVIATDRQDYSPDDTEFLRTYGYIELRPKELGRAGRLSQRLGLSKPVTIDTLTDTDAIMAILANYYGLQWA